MHLIEPQAGSDVGALRTKAVRADDGSYRITGQKIFITYGEHDSPTTSSISSWRVCRMRRRATGASLFLVREVPGE